MQTPISLQVVPPLPAAVVLTPGQHPTPNLHGQTEVKPLKSEDFEKILSSEESKSNKDSVTKFEDQNKPCKRSLGIQKKKETPKFTKVKRAQEKKVQQPSLKSNIFQQPPTQPKLSEKHPLEQMQHHMQGMAMYQHQMMQFYQYANREMPSKAFLEKQPKDPQLLKFQQQFYAYTMAAHQAAAHHFH
jgi:hypothetical protein